MDYLKESHSMELETAISEIDFALQCLKFHSEAVSVKADLDYLAHGITHLNLGVSQLRRLRPNAFPPVDGNR
jgi:hypothetical protein